MKKLTALVLSLVLSLVILVPANAATTTKMIFDCETDDGTGCHATGWGTRWGPVSAALDDYPAHPVPTQGDKSYCNATDTGQTVLYWNNTGYPNSIGVFDATQWENIELDLYSSETIIFNFSFGLCTLQADPAGSSGGYANVVLEKNTWTHVVVPLSSFGGFPADFPGTLNNINRIKVEFNNIVDPEYYEAPLELYLYMDNIIASKGGVSKPHTLMTEEEWWAKQDVESSEEPVSSVVEPSEEESSEIAPAIVYGDIDGTIGISSTDALKTLQFSVNKISLTEEQQIAADVDGTIGISATDALCILQYSVGKINQFPIEKK